LTAGDSERSTITSVPMRPPVLRMGLPPMGFDQL
jgi:hypothetical protein